VTFRLAGHVLRPTGAGFWICFGVRAELPE
jgi:hypothetical protein